MCAGIAEGDACYAGFTRAQGIGRPGLRRQRHVPQGVAGPDLDPRAGYFLAGCVIRYNAHRPHHSPSGGRGPNDPRRTDDLLVHDLEAWKLP